MKTIGIFYGKEAASTAIVAKKIRTQLDGYDTIMMPVEEAWDKDFKKFDYLIIGVSTWFDGELPYYWDEVIPELKSLDLKNKKVAIFGLGDQVNYPDNFVDGIGLLADAFYATGAKVIGHTSTKDYKFTHSLALKDGKFLGLAIDQENQPDKTDKRIEAWVKELKKELTP